MAILVAYDGSHPAQKAVERAVRAVDEEEVILLRVIEAADGIIEAGLDIVQERLKEMRGGRENKRVVRGHQSSAGGGRQRIPDRNCHRQAI